MWDFSFLEKEINDVGKLFADPALGESSLVSAASLVAPCAYDVCYYWPKLDYTIDKV